MKSWLLLTFLLSFHISRSQFIHVHNNTLCDPTGAKLNLEGVNLGGWLLWEGWIWGGGFTSETKVRERMTELMGTEKFNAFQQEYYKSFITEKDISQIAAKGYNCVRVPFNYRILESKEVDGWALLDSVVQWCANNHIYAVLDMHAAPGGQNNFFIADPEKETMWENEEAYHHTIDLWKKIALHFRDNPAMAGYDLLNEPKVKKKDTLPLVEAYKEIAGAIRSVDTNHMLIIEGNELAHKFDEFPAAIDTNQVYSYHIYTWFAQKKKKETLKGIVEPLKSPLPLWCGEWGEDTKANLAETEALIRVVPNYCGLCFWTWKRVYKNNNHYPKISVATTPEWDKMMKWVTWKIGKPKPEEVEKGTAAFLAAIR